MAFPIVAAISAAYSIYSSARKSAQAKKLAASNQRPIYNPDGTVQQVYDLAVSEVNNTNQQDFAARTLEQNQAEGLDTILKSGGRVDFGTFENSYGNNMRQLISQLDMNRSSKIAALNNAAYNKQKQDDTLYQVNQLDPFKDKKQQEALLRAQAGQELSDGLSAAVSGVADYMTENLSPGQYGAKAERKETRVMNRENNARSQMQRTNVQAPSTIPVIPVRSMQGGSIATAGINTNFDYANITGRDMYGSPIYG